MSLQTDQNGMFIYGMTHTDELGKFLQHKFPEHQIQQTYETLVEFSKDQAKLAKSSPLRMFWKHLEKVYLEGVPPLQCHRGCDHCCHTGVTCTQMEWDGILKTLKKKEST